MGGIILSVGLVSAVLVVGPQLFNRKNRDVAKKQRQNVVASVSFVLLCATAWWPILLDYHAFRYHEL